MTELLDHGRLRLIETWGSDEQIIASARMSTDGEFRGWEKDEKLLGYLYENKHLTPFEMCGATFEVQAPIFVMREWMRHRTFSYNEMSARYTPLPALDYVPTVERLLANANGSNKQANRIPGAPELTKQYAEWFHLLMKSFLNEAQVIYEQALAAGVPKELARGVLTVSRYSKMRVSGNLRNWMQFLGLREDSSAQYEIRCYAEGIHKELSDIFPRTVGLYETTKVKEDVYKALAKAVLEMFSE